MRVCIYSVQSYCKKGHDNKNQKCIIQIRTIETLIAFPTEVPNQIRLFFGNLFRSTASAWMHNNNNAFGIRLFFISIFYCHKYVIIQHYSCKILSFKFTSAQCYHFFIALWSKYLWLNKKKYVIWDRGCAVYLS